MLRKKSFWFIINKLNLYISIIYTNSEIHYFKYLHNKQLKTVFFYSDTELPFLCPPGTNGSADLKFQCALRALGLALRSSEMEGLRVASESDGSDLPFPQPSVPLSSVNSLDY